MTPIVAKLTKNAGIFSGPHAGATLHFARNIGTVDELGVQCAANTPRFGRESAVAGCLSDPETVISGLGANPNVHGGLDLDGRTLLVVLDDSGSFRRVRVLTESAPGSWTTRRTFNLARQASGSGIGANLGDIRLLAGTELDDGLCYMPRAFTVIHGTIVAFCEVRVRTSGTGTTWDASESRGCGFAVSNDYGATWGWSYDDTGDEFNNGASRGTGWSMNGYYCPFREQGQPFLEAWICACDYQFAIQPPSATASKGGTVYWFRLDRSAETERFVPANVSGTIITGRNNINLDSVNNSRVYSQRQGAAIFREGPNTIGILIAESDQRWSGITKLGNISRTDYTSEDLTTTKNFHGMRDSAAELPAADKATFTGNMTASSAVIGSASLAATWTNKLAAYNSLLGTVIRVAGAGAAGADLIASVTAFNEGAGTITLNTAAGTSVTGATCTIEARGDWSTGNQFVAACPGPSPGEVILGGDAVIGTMDVVDGAAAVCHHRRLWGGQSDERDPSDGTATGSTYQRWSCHRLFIAQLKVDAPERGTRVVVATLNRSTQIATAKPANIDTLLISRNSGRPGSWASVRWPDRSTYSPDSVGLHVANEYIYTTTSNSVRRYGLPGIVAGRPMLTSPGVSNSMRDNFGGTNGGYDFSTPDNFIRCPKVNGKFHRVSLAGVDTGIPLDPQPPIAHDPASATSGNVYRVRSQALTPGVAGPLPATSNYLATFPVCTRGSDISIAGTLDWANPYAGFFRARVFLLNASSLPESTLLAAGKSPANSYVQLRWDPYGGTGVSAFTAATWAQASNDTWDPITLQRDQSSWTHSPSGNVLMALLVGAGADRADNDVYVAFDSLVAGKGDYGYPANRATAGGTSGPVVITPRSNPNEVAKVSGFGLGGGNSFTFFAIGRVAEHAWDHFTRRDATDTEWPIMSLYADSDNHIQIAPSPWSTTSSGSSPWPINREGRLRFTITDDGSDTAKEQTGATFMRGEGLVICIRFDADTDTVTIDAVCSGQRMATQTYEANVFAGLTFNEVRFSNPNQTTLASFGWLHLYGLNRHMNDGEVGAQLKTLAFTKHDPTAAKLT